MKKILVIDDEKVTQTIVERFLKTEGYEVLSASDGLEGLEKARHSLPNLILLDLHMPKIDGLSLCHMLKQDTLTAHIPILFLSAEGKLGFVEDALKEGADGYITKPFDFQRLLEKLEAIFSGT